MIINGMVIAIIRNGEGVALQFGAIIYVFFLLLGALRCCHRYDRAPNAEADRAPSLAGRKVSVPGKFVDRCYETFCFVSSACGVQRKRSCRA